MSPVKALDRADVLALAASIYEMRPRMWQRADTWICPQCGLANKRKCIQCRCGISRDGLPEFCERELDGLARPLFRLTMDLNVLQQRMSFVKRLIVFALRLIGR